VNVAETSPFLDAAADAYLAAYVAAARALGAGWIVVHAGYHFTADKPARLEAATARLDRAAARAEGGVTLLLENMNREPDDAEVHYLGHDIEECRALFGRLRSPALRWSYTVNHAHLLPGVGIEGFLDAMDLGRCGEVRLADCRGTVEEHLRPGEGTIDFPRMFALLEGRGWRGHYMQAFGPLEDMLAGRETLARMAAAGLAAAGRGRG
jgi:sugar phosphate isomerase/epimerase